MSEGIIHLNHILFYLYKCHEQTCCHGSAWAYGMTADNHVSRGSPLIGATRQRFPRGELVWVASWLIELGRRFQSEQTCFVMLRDIDNSEMASVMSPDVLSEAERLILRSQSHRAGVWTIIQIWTN